MSTTTNNWRIDEKNFQGLYELHFERIQQREISRSSKAHYNYPIETSLAIDMKELTTNIIEKAALSNMRISESYIINEFCLNFIKNWKDAKELTFHLIQIGVLPASVKNKIIDIKENDLQFAVSFDNSKEIYLMLNVTEPIPITTEFPEYLKLFFNNLKPGMDEDIKNKTHGLKTENTNKIFIPKEDFENFKDKVYVHPALNDVNFNYIFHSITHLFNFTVILSDSEVLDSKTANVNMDVYRTCQPYCSGTVGGII